jgi:hypothetical protein
MDGLLRPMRLSSRTNFQMDLPILMGQCHYELHEAMCRYPALVARGEYSKNIQVSPPKMQKTSKRSLPDISPQTRSREQWSL